MVSYTHKEQMWQAKAGKEIDMNAIEIKAYEIGIKEAHEQRKIVPACKSNAMYALMKEVENGLLPLIKAYDAGVAYEINRQTKLGF